MSGFEPPVGVGTRLQAHVLAYRRPTSMIQGGGQSLLVETEGWSVQDYTKVEAKAKKNEMGTLQWWAWHLSN